MAGLLGGADSPLLGRNCAKPTICDYAHRSSKFSQGGLRFQGAKELKGTTFLPIASWLASMNGSKPLSIVAQKYCEEEASVVRLMFSISLADGIAPRICSVFSEAVPKKTRSGPIGNWMKKSCFLNPPSQ